MDDDDEHLLKTRFYLKIIYVISSQSSSAIEIPEKKPTLFENCSNSYFAGYLALAARRL